MLDSDVTLATVLGHAFEHFVKAGCARALQNARLELPQKSISDFRYVSLNRLVALFSELGITDQGELSRLERYLEHMAGWASIAGYGLIRDYLKNVIGDGSSGEVCLQWLFCPLGSHHLGLAQLEKESRQQAFNTLVQKLNLPAEKSVLLANGPAGKGRFRDADWISLIKKGRRWHVLVLEFSLYAANSAHHLPDPGDPAAVLNHFRSVVGLLRRRGTYSQLNLDLTENDIAVSSEMSNYLDGIRRADKPAKKLFQGCAYATDFLDRLAEVGFEMKKGLVQVIAVTDRGTQSIAAQFEHRNRLRPFAEIIWNQTAGKGESWEEVQSRQRKVAFRTLVSSFPIEARKEIRKLREVALSRLESATLLTAEIQEPITQTHNPAEPVTLEQIQEWLTTPEIQNWIPDQQKQIQKSLKLYQNPTLRDAHALFVQALLDRDYPDARIPVIALTGHPGIGKTTAIRNSLLMRPHGFLFLYFSPRIQINRDILGNFENQSEPPIVTLTTNAATIDEFIQIREAERRHHRELQPISGAVVYGGCGVCLPEEFKNVRLVRDKVEREIEAGPAVNRERRYREQSVDTIVPRSSDAKGVLACLSAGIECARKTGIDRIVAAVSTQALKAVVNGKKTIDALGAIVPQKNKSPWLGGLDQFAARIPEIVVMLDELTGSSEGVMLLHDIVSRLDQWFVTPYDEANRKSPFRIRVIVADASLTDERVAERFLAETRPEPPKIIVSPAGSSNPISLGSFHFCGQAVPLLNASSFPARSLTLNYHLTLVPAQIGDHGRVEAKPTELTPILNDRLVEAVITALSEGARQIIVFVQDIRRLDDLAEELKSACGFKGPDILKINSRIRNSERARIIEEKHHLSARVILITSSASRGISFPLTTVILAEVPRFAPEQSLMEIVQLIYRGRGTAHCKDGHIINGDYVDRRIEFFLTETLGPSNSEERINDLLAMCVLLRAAVMTRICGVGYIGDQAVSVVPVGVKLVEISDQTDTEEIINFLGELEKELHATSNSALRSVCQLTHNAMCMMFRTHGNHRIINISKQSQSTRLDAEIFRRDWIERSLVPSIRNGLDGIVTIPEFPVEAMYCSGLLVEERVGEMSDELIILNREESRATTRQLKGLLQALRTGLLTSKNGFTTKLDIRSRQLMSGAARMVDLLDSLFYSKASGDITQDRQRLEHRHREGVWLAQPALCFSKVSRWSEHFSISSREIHREWYDLISELTRIQFGKAQRIAPVVAAYDDIPFGVFRLNGVEMFREQIFSPSAFNATHEFQLLNIFLLRQQEQTENPG